MYKNVTIKKKLNPFIKAAENTMRTMSGKCTSVYTNRKGSLDYLKSH